jgi:hypothetical protein
MSPIRASGPPCSTCRGCGASRSRCIRTKDEAEILAPEAVEARMQRFAKRAQPYDVPYKGIYRVHQRVAKDGARAASCSPATPRTSTIRSAPSA